MKKLCIFLLALMLGVGQNAQGQSFVELQKILASDGANFDLFGVSVSISGNTALVGAYLDDDNGPSSGSAYVYELQAGTWMQVAKLTAADGADFDSFGWSVSISGNTALVGAYLDDDKGDQSGTAYVYEKPVAGWSGILPQTAKLTAADGANFDRFGYSVSISGNTVLVGAYLDDDNGPNSGSAYVYEKPLAGWSGILPHTAKLTASDAAIADFFGFSVSISGNTALVGAFHDDDHGSSSGSAYVYEKPLAGWSGILPHTAKLTAADGASGNFVGYSVSISGNTALVGAYQDDDHGNQSGSAYVYEKPVAGWSGILPQTAKLTAADGSAGDRFGYSVSISGNTALVGAYRDDDHGFDSGSAYVYEKPVAGWSGILPQTAKLTAADGAGFDSFGISVSISGNMALVGAYADDDNGSSSGSAYFFGPPPPPAIANNDANGDGTPDIADPCSCNDPMNVEIAGQYYFHELITVTSQPTETWQLQNLNSGSIFDNAGNPLTPPLNLTETTAGVYNLDIWHLPNTGYNADFNRTAAPLGTALSIGNSCAQVDEPSVSLQNGCDLTNGANFSMGGDFFIQEILNLSADPVQTWEISAITQGNIYNAGGVAQTAPIELMDLGGGNYQATFWHKLNEGFALDLNEPNGPLCMPAAAMNTCSSTITNDDPSIEDPCSCFDPNNYMLDGQIYFHEIVTVTSGPGETWQMTNLISGPIFDNMGNDISGILPINLTETPPGSGIYTLDFWHLPNQGYDAQFNRTVVPLATPLQIANSCTDCNNIPTVSEWGLIIFGLLLACAGILVLRWRRKLEVDLVTERSRGIS